MNTIFNPFPILVTERLILRPLGQNDHAELWRLRSDEKINQYLERPKHPTSDDVHAHIKKIETFTAENKSFTWVICFKDDPALIGSICLWNYGLENDTVDIGYELFPNYQGQGIMNEATEKVIEFGLEQMQAKMILAVTHNDNKKSQALLKRHGFELDPDYKYVDKEEAGEDNVVYFLVRK